MEEIDIICIFYNFDKKIMDTFAPNVKVRSIIEPHEIKTILDPDKEDPRAANTCAIFYSPINNDYSPSEVAQTLSFKYPDKPIIYITKEIQLMKDREMMKKNGFNDLFLDPFETELINKKIMSILDQFKVSKAKNYTAVKLVDIEVGAVLDFDIYILLSANKKYIKFIPAGTVIDESKMDKLKKHEMSLLYIPNESLKKFYEYTANQLSSINGSKKLSETERQQKMENSLRNLTFKFFDTTVKTDSAISDGKEIFTELKEISENYILKTDGGSWYKKMQMAVGGGHDPYSHSSRVSTLATLFSMALGKGKPELVSIAGLIHDLGKSLLPKEILEKTEEEMSKEEFKKYIQHPELSLRLLKERRMAVEPELAQCILLHHKKWNGGGFPSGLTSGEKIPIEAQLLCIADEFDYYTNVAEGKLKTSPAQAFDKMIEKFEHNPMILKQLKKVFAPES